MSQYWSKAILLVDMDAFFASVEQLDHPELRGKPVVITNGEAGSTIITCSYEARREGVHTGMSLWKARQLCPSLIRCGSHPRRYTEISCAVMQALARFTPDIEVFSIDEAFLDVTKCQRLYGSPSSIARQVKQAVFHATGLTCSVGVSGDKTTAKYAAGLDKPNGCVVIPPWEAKQRLAPVSVTELCGVGTGVARFLARYGVVTCGQMARLPIGLLAKHFGNFGRRLWYMCQGADPYHVVTQAREAKSMGHGKVLPPGTMDRRVILSYFHQMCERLAARLRRNGCWAQSFFVGMRVQSLGWLGGRYATVVPTHDGKPIYHLCQLCLHEHGSGFVVQQVQVTALSLIYSGVQMDLFHAPEGGEGARASVNEVVDCVHQRFGSGSLYPADRLLLDQLVQVIAPSWQPDGARQSIMH